MEILAHCLNFWGHLVSLLGVPFKGFLWDFFISYQVVAIAVLSAIVNFYVRLQSPVKRVCVVVVVDFFFFLGGGLLLFEVVLIVMLSWIFVIADRVPSVWERSFHVPHPPLAHVWIHDQLYPQIETPAGEIHDEQCAGKLHNIAGVCDFLYVWGGGRGWRCLISSPCLESQGCCLIPLFCLFSCSSAKLCCSFCLVPFLLMVHSLDLFLPEDS